MSAPHRIRAIIMHRGRSASHSWTAAVQGNPNLDRIALLSGQLHSRQLEKVQEAFSDAVQCFASTKLDGAGTYSADLELVIFTTFSQCLMSDSPLRSP